MPYERDLLQQALRRWTRREVPQHGEVADARSPIRSLANDDIRGFDNQGLFVDISDELVPGVDPEP